MLIDDAVRRILIKKFELGLFDDPYKFINPDREKTALNRPENLEAARDMARKSMVLLKNDNNLLPLSKNVKTVALIGPLVKAEKELKGFWSLDVDQNKGLVPLIEGMKNHAPDTKFIYSQGCSITGESHDGFADAVAAAKKANVVIMAMGEAPDMTGEAKSRSNIHLPGVQEDLIKALYATGKPIVVIINAGRPLIFNWTADNAPAILYTWWLGSEAGNAIANVLFGDYNPGGRLPFTYPRTPNNYLTYDHKLFETTDTAYGNSATSPQFDFGTGLSYTTYSYRDLKVSPTSVDSNGKINVSVNVTNTGSRAGKETAILYVRDEVASISPPGKRVKRFAKVYLEPGRSKTLSFTLDRDDLSFIGADNKPTVEPGEFTVMIGGLTQKFTLR